jgi:hypothetical protein
MTSCVLFAMPLSRRRGIFLREDSISAASLPWIEEIQSGPCTSRREELTILKSGLARSSLRDRMPRNSEKSLHSEQNSIKAVVFSGSPKCLLGVTARNGNLIKFRPSKHYSTKRKRSRIRLQLVLREDWSWRNRCFAVEV